MKNILLVLVFVLLQILTSCKEEPVFSNFNGFIQGTTYRIIYDNTKEINTEALKIEVEKILHDFDKSLSIYDESSIISKINRDEDVVVDSQFKEVFLKSVLLNEITAGAFDITVGPLVKAWGFGPDAHKDFSKDKLDSLMALVGMSKVSLIDDHIIKTNPGIYLDVNAIAQGYSVDVICEYFDKLRIPNYLIEIGGEIRTKGTKAGAFWRVGIDRPEDFNMSPGKNLQAIIRISDQSLGTSGNYRKFYVEDGVKYSHTIDPRTGYPAKNKLLSATIVAPDCITADGMATSCMVIGIDSAKAFILNNPELSAYFIFSDDNGNFKTWMSESLKEKITEEQ